MYLRKNPGLRSAALGLAVMALAMGTGCDQQAAGSSCPGGRCAAAGASSIPVASAAAPVAAAGLQAGTQGQYATALTMLAQLRERYYQDQARLWRAQGLEIEQRRKADERSQQWIQYLHGQQRGLAQSQVQAPAPQEAAPPSADAPAAPGILGQEGVTGTVAAGVEAASQAVKQAAGQERVVPVTTIGEPQPVG